VQLLVGGWAEPFSHFQRFYAGFRGRELKVIVAASAARCFLRLYIQKQLLCNTDVSIEPAAEIGSVPIDFEAGNVSTSNVVKQ
jgi:hypothetical protein